MEWNNGNDIAEIEGKKKFAMGSWQCHCRNREVKKKFGIVKSGMELGNAIATIPFHFFFFFFLRNDKCTQFLQYFHNKF